MITISAFFFEAHFPGIFSSHDFLIGLHRKNKTIKNGMCDAMMKTTNAQIAYLRRWNWVKRRRKKQIANFDIASTAMV